MVEKQSINGKDVWLRIDPHPIQRENPNIIPKEYFSATCFMQDPAEGASDGEVIKDEEGGAKMFESPVAALSYACKKLEEQVNGS